MSRRAVRVAGLGYTATWCVGLAVFSSSTTVSSTGRELLGQYAGHSPVLALQFLLTQGLAAVLLGIVLAAWVGMATGTGRVLVAWAGLSPGRKPASARGRPRRDRRSGPPGERMALHYPSDCRYRRCA